MISKISTRDGYGRRLSEIDNDKIVVLTADLGESSRVKQFADKHPERFIQVGISEQDMFGMANGLAIQGKIPLTNTFSAFCLRGHDQIRLIAINNSNVKIIGHHSGISLGQDGVSQMCEEDISVFRTMPNFAVVIPSDALEAQKALDAILKINKPCYLRLSREPWPVITNEFSEFNLGKANIVREGNDVLIVACGMMVSEALRASNLLSEKNISACLMNMHTIKPLDKDLLLRYASKCKAVVTVEEHSIYGGLGSAVSEALSLSKIPVKILGINDKFGESGKPDELFEKFGLTAENIVNYSTDVLMFKEKTAHDVKEINDIMQEINHVAKENKVEDNSINNSNSSNGNSNSNGKYDKDPRNRITKITPEQKAQMDNVLAKMFGGRKNGN
ncbi:TPA: transketolase family protein [Candidatus Woesearchaeota archaeon]|nr:transketolase family protein [Candidatus Woesearchaeota archaeon]HIH55263.1 transketolase family protein [Candidatus Woesearchaeota archaeon]HIJ02412.1 transketolase family protein [Candidatus Woesearchaeota archaeon]HIJ13313.1 transketolase family protein [Candidatus Woesearchaeota archaeon]